MRKTRVRKRTNKKHAHKRSTRRARGGSITTPMVGTFDGRAHKGLGKIVIAGPMGGMSGRAYVKMMDNLDQQGPE